MPVELKVAVIAFSAVIVGAIITWTGNVFLQHSMRSWQREQWLLDKKTAEYKELLSTLATSVESMAQNSSDFGMKVPKLVTEDQQRLAFGEAAGRRIAQDDHWIGFSSRSKSKPLLFSICGRMLLVNVTPKPFGTSGIGCAIESSRQHGMIWTLRDAEPRRSPIDRQVYLGWPRDSDTGSRFQTVASASEQLYRC